MRLWPRSLAGQLAVLLVTAVVAAQAVAYVILAANVSDVRHGAARTHAVERLVVLTHVLAAAPPPSADRIVAAFDTPRHRISIGSSSLVEVGVMSADETRLARRLLNRLDGVASDARVTLVERPDRADGHAPRRPQALQVSIRLKDGRWLNESAAFKVGGGRRVFEFLLVSVLAIVAAVLVAVRLITRPLKLLASAAERFGRGEGASAVVPAGSTEMQQVIESFDEMQERIRTYVEERSRMIAAISHDLRTPITALRLRAELIDDVELREAMIATLTEMQRMTEATLSFVRDEATREETRTTDLVALVEAIADDFVVAGHTVTVAAPEALPFRCRATALRRALGNLIENAIRYGGTARVRLAKEAAAVRITVDDDGPGIPEDRIEGVFQPFARLDDSRSDATGGQGLGLAIVRSVVQAHGGSVRLRNRTEGGLSAEVVLPMPAEARAAIAP